MAQIIQGHGEPISFTNKAFSNDETITIGHNEFNDKVIRRKSGNSNSLQIEQSATTTSSSSSSNDNNACLDFDDMLPLIGEFGPYQKVLFFCMIPFAFFVAFVYFSQIFLTLVPEQHWCNVPELRNLSLNERLELSVPIVNGEYSNCHVYNVNFTEVLAQGLKKPDPSWGITKCQSDWSYNLTEIPYISFAMENDWVCDKAAYATYAQSIFFLGAIVGGLLFGWIADKFGRIPALVGCNLIAFFGGTGTIFAYNFWQFATMRFFVGFAFDNCFTMMYILVLEYVGPKYRTFVANMSIAIFFTCASCLLPWIAYYIANWKIFALVTSVPLLLVILTPLIVPESARWLVSQGKIEKAVKILKKLEIRNKKSIDAQTYQVFKESCEKLRQDENKNKNHSVLDLFKTPRLRRTTLLLVVIWMAISLVFDGHVRNVGSLGLDIFLTFTIASFTELPADTLLTFTLDRFGRRWLACGTMVASGIFSLLATVVSVGIYSASLAIAGRFFVNISYNIGLQYAAEILPTVVRAQGVAFIHIMGYVASIIAPFVVYLAYIDPTFPLIILGIIGIVGGLLSLLLPETLNQDLPQTLSDGEDFGRGQSIWDFPCLAKTVDDDTFPTKTEHFQRSSQTGASLNATTGAEIRSSILRRSARSRYSSKL